VPDRASSAMIEDVWSRKGLYTKDGLARCRADRNNAVSKLGGACSTLIRHSMTQGPPRDTSQKIALLV
jgi:hypothetical protein